MTDSQERYYDPKNRYYATTDASFVTGDSPVTLDVETTLKRKAIDGFIICDGAGNISVTLSNDGTNYGDTITLKANERFSLFGLEVSKIKITWVADSAYRVFAR